MPNPRLLSTLLKGLFSICAGAKTDKIRPWISHQPGKKSSEKVLQSNLQGMRECSVSGPHYDFTSNVGLNSLLLSTIIDQCWSLYLPQETLWILENIMNLKFAAPLRVPVLTFNGNLQVWQKFMLHIFFKSNNTRYTSCSLSTWRKIHLKLDLTICFLLIRWSP